MENIGEEQRFCAHIKFRIPTWNALKNAVSSNPTVILKGGNTTCKTGFLGKVEHSFTIGFYWDNGVTMGGHFFAKSTNDDPPIEVKSILFKFGSNPTDWEMFLAGIPPTDWVEAKSGQFFLHRFPPGFQGPTGAADLCVDLNVVKGRTKLKGGSSPPIFHPLALGAGDEKPEDTSGVMENVDCKPFFSSSESSMPFVDVVGKYFLSEDYSDARLECTDRVTLPVHRFVLISRSDYFSVTLRTGWKEMKMGGKIRVAFSSKCIKELLRFIYTGKLTSPSTELFEAADMYGLKELKQLCEEHLKNGITPENALKMYELGTHHGSLIITESAKQVLHSNKRQWIDDPEIFKKVTVKHPKLMLELFKM